MTRCYGQYCPIANALDLVGERWSLLVVRELMAHGPLRYSDLHARLEGCGTNILAARLKHLEQGGVVRKRRLEPPAATTVYELTEYGQALRPVLHTLAHWGARVMGPPGPDDLEPGWLAGALGLAFPPLADGPSVEFRIGDEVASLDGAQVVEGPIDGADATVTGDPPGFYRLLVDRDLEAVAITGRRHAVESLLELLPAPAALPEPARASP